LTDDPGLACPSPLLDGASISNVGWCFHRCRHSPPRLPVDDIGWWYVGLDVLEDVTISPRSGGGHNDHGETGEYVVRRGSKSTFG
jgi:hypothetical protein